MTIQLPPGHRVYAIGDVHGMLEPLHRLLAAIEEDLCAHPAEEVTEVFLGDYVDRGPDPFGVIETLIANSTGRRRVCLMGNHEDAMLSGLRDGDSMLRWLGFGGAATVKAYGIDPQEHGHDPLAIQARLHAVLPDRHLAFLTNLLMRHVIGETLFVHAGIRPGVPLEAQEVRDLLWIRDDFLEHDGPLPLHVVHGHTPVEAPETRRFRTNVDTGAVFGGRLTAAVLEDQTVRFLSVPTQDTVEGSCPSS